ncbi:MAG: GNAT family protein [Pseudomonadota bacterium]
MSNRLNDFGQPIGDPVPDWTGCAHPGHKAMQGVYARLVSLDPLSHAQDLFDAYRQDTTGQTWTYNYIGPFNTVSNLKIWMDKASGNDTQPYFAIVNNDTGKAQGIASFMNIRPSHGVIEIGGITLAPALQRTRVSTDAIYLMMHRAMNQLGYRRLEWKCDALNAPSRAAALRFGYSFDGVFRQAAVYKGRNRDAAWYSLLDLDWPRVKRGFTQWLAAENFDESGQQRRRLKDLITSEPDTGTV